MEEWKRRATEYISGPSVFLSLLKIEERVNASPGEFDEPQRRGTEELLASIWFPILGQHETHKGLPLLCPGWVEWRYNGIFACFSSWAESNDWNEKGYFCNSKFILIGDSGRKGSCVPWVLLSRYSPYPRVMVLAPWSISTMRAVVSSHLPHLHFSQLKGGKRKAGNGSKLPFQGMARSCTLCFFSHSIGWNFIT